jgi:hypothetical protein
VLIASNDLDVQQEVLAKLINSELLKSHFLFHILRAKETKVQTKIIQKIKTHVNVVKCAKTKYHLVAKHATLSMVVSKHGENVATISKVLKVHYNNVVDAVQRCHALEDGGGSNVWALECKNVRSNALNKMVANVIEWWWVDASYGGSLFASLWTLYIVYFIQMQQTHCKI